MTKTLKIFIVALISFFILLAASIYYLSYLEKQSAKAEYKSKIEDVEHLSD